MVASLSAIYFATISPFKFVIPQGFSGEYLFIIKKFHFGSSIKDYWQNVLLFIPLGISLGIIAQSVPRSYLRVIIFGCLGSMIASTAVEFTQIFLPSRVSNLSDIICNSLGGCLGATLYYCHRRVIKFVVGLLTADLSKLSLKSLLVAIFGYCFLIFLATWLLLTSVNLSNWDDNFYLALGNEVTGDRPWNGNINRLYICDRGINQSEIVEAFESLAKSDTFFAQLPSLVLSLESLRKQNYAANNHKKNPHLSWHSTSSSTQINRVHSFDSQQKISHGVEQDSGIYLNQKQWLKSDQPAKFLIHKLKESGEFSIFIKIASREINQTGPARIMTLSNGIYAQNLLIGQENTNLSFRLRTPLTGNLPTQPEFIISDVFKSHTEGKILIIFAQNKLSFYLQNSHNKYSFEFTPANNFMSYLPWNRTYWIVNLKNHNPAKYQRYFYFIIVIPLSILIWFLIYYLLFNYRSD